MNREYYILAAFLVLSPLICGGVGSEAGLPFMYGVLGFTGGFLLAAFILAAWFWSGVVTWGAGSGFGKGLLLLLLALCSGWTVLYTLGIWGISALFS